MKIEKIKKCIRAIIWTYIFVGIVLFGGAFFEWGIFPDFYMPYLMGSLAFVSATLIYLPNLLYKKAGTTEKRSAIAYLHLTVAVGLLINGAGGLGLYKLYKVGFQYDKLTHFVTPLIFTLALTYLFQNWHGRRFGISLVFSSIIVLVASFLWEGLEYISDIFLGTHLFGGGSSEVITDTIGDIIANFLGVITASVVLIAKRK